MPLKINPRVSGWDGFPKKSSKSTNFLPDFKTKCSLFYFLITPQLVLILKFKKKNTVKR